MATRVDKILNGLWSQSRRNPLLRSLFPRTVKALNAHPGTVASFVTRMNSVGRGLVQLSHDDGGGLVWLGEGAEIQKGAMVSAGSRLVLCAGSVVRHHAPDTARGIHARRAASPP